MFKFTYLNDISRVCCHLILPVLGLFVVSRSSSFMDSTRVWDSSAPYLAVILLLETPSFLLVRWK